MYSVMFCHSILGPSQKFATYLTDLETHNFFFFCALACLLSQWWEPVELSRELELKSLESSDPDSAERDCDESGHHPGRAS